MKTYHVAFCPYCDWNSASTDGYWQSEGRPNNDWHHCQARGNAIHFQQLWRVDLAIDPTMDRAILGTVKRHYFDAIKPPMRRPAEPPPILCSQCGKPLQRRLRAFECEPCGRVVA